MRRVEPRFAGAARGIGVEGARRPPPVETGGGRRDQQHAPAACPANGVSGVTRSPRPSTRARAAGEEERHVRAGRGGGRAAVLGAERPAPHASSAPSIAAAASLLPPARPGGHGDALLQPRRERERLRAAADDAARLGDATEHGAEAGGVQRGPAVRPPTTWRLSSAPAARARLSRSASAQRHHHRVEGVEAVAPGPEHGEGEVQLGRRQADDRRERRGCSRARRLTGCASRRRSQSSTDERLRPPVARDPGRGEGRVDPGLPDHAAR